MCPLWYVSSPILVKTLCTDSHPQAAVVAVQSHNTFHPYLGTFLIHLSYILESQQSAALVLKMRSHHAVLHDGAPSIPTGDSRPYPGPKLTPLLSGFSSSPCNITCSTANSILWYLPFFQDNHLKHWI